MLGRAQFRRNRSVTQTGARAADSRRRSSSRLGWPAQRW
jgi:hypothetical protein